jgi:hypothetical protein
MSTPYLEMYVETFWSTHCSAALTLPATRASSSLGRPTMTWMPECPSALSAGGSASKSLTLSKPLSRSRRTVISPGRGRSARVPQFTASPSTGRARNTAAATHSTASARNTAHDAMLSLLLLLRLTA